MHCLRLARAFTGRPKILKFEGNFHGYHDQVMFAIGTPADRLGPETAPTAYPGSTGIARRPGRQPGPRAVQSARPAGRGASAGTPANWPRVICEPIYYNAGCIMPTPEFLRCAAAG